MSFFKDRESLVTIAAASSAVGAVGLAYWVLKPRTPILTESIASNHFRHLAHTASYDGPNESWTPPHRIRLSKKNLAMLPEKLDVILVGSGLGALTVASLLSQRRYKVLVLEQHDQAGGCLHTFEDKGFEFDVGLHYVGGKVGNRWSLIRKAFDAVTGGRVEWCKMSDPYDLAVCTGEKDSRETFEFTGDYFRTAKMLKAEFPEEAKGIDRFFASAHAAQLQLGGWAACKLFPPFLRRLLCRFLLSSPVLTTTTAQHLKHIGIASTKLSGILTYLFGDYGLHPSLSSWAVHAIVFDHWRGGAFYPYGGSSALAMGACEVIRQNKGHVFVNARVDSIVMENGHAVGVKLVKDGTVLKAPIIVSDAGARSTFLKLVPESSRSLLDQNFLKSLIAGGQATLDGSGLRGGLAPSCTLLNLFVGLSASASSLGVPASNAWVVPGWDHDRNIEDFINNPDADLPVVFIGSNSAKDESYKKRFGDARGSIMVLAPVNYAWFKAWEEKRVHSRGGEYDDLKKHWTERLLNKLYQVYPKTKGAVVFHDLGTPLSNNYYLNVSHGEVYGLTHSVERMTSPHLSSETDIPGLYITGQDTMTAGVSAALLAGLMTTASITKVGILSHMHNLVGYLV